MKRCPDDSYEKHPATFVNRDKTGLKLETSSSSSGSSTHMTFNLAAITSQQKQLLPVYRNDLHD